jgi:hypothetical protein
MRIDTKYDLGQIVKFSYENCGRRDHSFGEIVGIEVVMKEVETCKVPSMKVEYEILSDSEAIASTYEEEDIIQGYYSMSPKKEVSHD